MSRYQLVLASGNKGKLLELQSILKPLAMDIVTQTELGIDSVPETGLTLVENAIIKARHAAEQSGLPALADDSGIAVDALNGQPGIYSARYAGEQASDSDNVEKLLTALKDVAPDKRQAQFHCVIVYMRHAQDPTPLICHGSWQGQILSSKQGDNGFGYDPVFYLKEQDCSAAELDRDTKNRLSHRGKALRQLLDSLRSST
jgi:XTP/dITP diphosphohydrolase